jgi:hypothetical protein
MNLQAKERQGMKGGEEEGVKKRKKETENIH